MPLDAEFKEYLRSLMVEMAEKTQDEWVRHKNELVGKAIATHNGAALPIAYKDAELYRMELRLSKTIEKYIEAVSIWGYSIDASFERDMTSEFQSLTAGPNQVPFPPAIKGQHAQAVRGPPRGRPALCEPRPTRLRAAARSGRGAPGYVSGRTAVERRIGIHRGDRISALDRHQRYLDQLDWRLRHRQRKPRLSGGRQQHWRGSHRTHHDPG